MGVIVQAHCASLLQAISLLCVLLPQPKYCPARMLLTGPAPHSPPLLATAALATAELGNQVLR